MKTQWPGSGLAAGVLTLLALAAYDPIQGAEVTIKGFHARDASQNRGMLRELVTSDGKVYGMFGPQQGPQAQ